MAQRRFEYGCQDAPGAPALPPNFETLFRDTSSPIAAPWQNNGVLWTKTNTLYTPPAPAGIAYGTQGNSGAFDDSYAYLQMGRRNMRVGGRIRNTGSTSGFMECELLLLVKDSSGFCQLVECNFAYSGQYNEIIGWKGPLGTTLGDFIFFSSGNASAPNVDGTIVEAQIVGNIVSTFINGTPHASADITVGTGGIVYDGTGFGLGFYRDGGTAMDNYCFDRWWCYGL